MRLFVLLAALLALPAHAEPETAEEIQACVEANRPQRSSSQQISFKTTDRMGSNTLSVAKLHWQDQKEKLSALVRFSAPVDLRGSALLMIRKKERTDMFVYLPELQKVRRVSQHSVRGSMFGTDLSYEDFERLQGMVEDADQVRREDAEVEGRPVYVVEGKPARGGDSQYERVVSFVDRETCVPIRLELYEKGERLRKVMTVPMEKVGTFQSFDRSIHVPLELTVRDVVDGTSTDVIQEDFELDKKLPRKLFSERELMSGGR